MARLTGEQLAAMGYYYTEHAPCVGVLRYGDLEWLITCPKPAQVLQVQWPATAGEREEASPPT